MTNQVEHLDDYDDEEPEPPTVDDVALAAMQGLLASGKFDANPDVAVSLAWRVCVPAYYKERLGFSDFMNTINQA